MWYNLSVFFVEIEREKISVSQKNKKNGSGKLGN
jgi:hypothetical protein